MRIILFDEVRATADFFTYIWEDAFKKAGHTVFTIHIQHFEEQKPEIIKFLSVMPDFALCYNNAAFSLEVIPGENFWDTLGVPVINILFDHPGAYWQILENAPSVMVPACCDRNHLKFLERHFPEMKKGIFLPHFGLELAECGEELIKKEAVLSIDEQADKNNAKTVEFADEIPWNDRKIPVLYVGSPSFPAGSIDDFATKVLEILNSDFGRTVESAIEEIIRSLSLDVLRKMYSEMWNAMESLGLYEQAPKDVAEQFEYDRYLEASIQKYHFLHAHITSRHRRMLVKQLVDAGIDVYAYSDWSKEKELLANPHFHFGGMISPMECVELMRNSKIVLNSMPWFKDGNHDRICHGMLQKAVVVSETSRYLEERFTDGKEIRLFTLEQLEKGGIVSQMVKEILDNPDMATKMAQNGYNNARVNDTVQQRMKTLMDYICI